MWDLDLKPHSSVALPLIHPVICHKSFKIFEPPLSYLLNGKKKSVLPHRVFLRRGEAESSTEHSLPLPALLSESPPSELSQTPQVFRCPGSSGPLLHGLSPLGFLMFPSQAQSSSCTASGQGVLYMVVTPVFSCLQPLIWISDLSVQGFTQLPPLGISHTQQV